MVQVKRFFTKLTVVIMGFFDTENGVEQYINLLQDFMLCLWLK